MKNRENEASIFGSIAATHTVLNVKLDMAGLVSIPVSKQIWTGWPENIAEDLSLAQIGIPQEHKLTVDTSGPKNVRKPSTRTSSTRSSYVLHFVP